MFGFDNIPQIGRIMDISDKIVSVFRDLFDKTDCLEKFETTGIIPVKIKVYDYDISVVIKDKRKTAERLSE